MASFNYIFFSDFGPLCTAYRVLSMYSDNRKWTKGGELEVQTGGLLSNFWSFQIGRNVDRI